jgi:hypothetical protein
VSKRRMWVFSNSLVLEAVGLLSCTLQGEGVKGHTPRRADPVVLVLVRRSEDAQHQEWSFHAYHPILQN